MSSVSNANSSETAVASSEPAASEADESSSSLFDKLDTAATVVRVFILAFVVVFTLIPVVGLLLGAAPFDAPPKTPYFALVGFALVSTVALVGAEIYDV